MKSLAPPTPVTSGGTSHGTSALRWGTSWVQQLDASISVDGVAAVQQANTSTGTSADARLLAVSATQTLGLVMRGDAHTTNLIAAQGDAILYTTSPILRLQWNGNMRAHGTGTDWVVGIGEGVSTAASGGVRSPDITGTDAAGTTLTVRGGLSRGTGAGGSVVIQAGTTGGVSGTTQNAAATRVTFSAGGTAFAGAVTSDTSIWNLGSGQFYKDVAGNIGLGLVPSGSYHLQIQRASTAVYASSSAAAAVPSGYLLMSGANSATATDGTSTLFVLSATNSTGSGSIVYYGLVNGPTASFASNFVIGRRTGSTAYSESFRVNTAGETISGNGDAVAAPAAGVFRATDGSGTDIAGASLTVRAGKGTGAGAPGSLIFQTSTAGTTGTTLQTATTRLTISATTITSTLPVLQSSATGGLGYSTGAGGTVTQLTSKATGVTLSKPTGQITTAADALAAGAVVSFTLTNTLLAATDNITVQRQSGGTAGAYRVWVDSVAAGSCVVCIENRSASSLSEALVLNMNLHKGANA